MGHSPSRELVTVGVTGSAGKTTTSWLIRGIFEELGQHTGMLGASTHECPQADRPSSQDVHREIGLQVRGRQRERALSSVGM